MSQLPLNEINISKPYSFDYCKQAQSFSAMTLTFGDRAEGHQGMQQFGQLADSSFSIPDLEEAKRKFEAKQCVCELVDLNAALIGTEFEGEEAKVLIVRQGLNVLDESLNADKLFHEQMNLEWDTKALMYGQLRTKKSRSNLCYGEESQEPDYMAKKGRIVAFPEIPMMNMVRSQLGEYFGDKGRDLVAEGNYYFNVKECGIGFHGDGERRKVIAVRLGASMPLHYQWFLKHEPIGKRVELMLGHGDICVMSEKASGFDWMRHKKTTLRHAAGAEKFLKVKTKKDKGQETEENEYGVKKRNQRVEEEPEKTSEEPQVRSTKGGGLSQKLIAIVSILLVAVTVQLLLKR